MKVRLCDYCEIRKGKESEMISSKIKQNYFYYCGDEGGLNLYGDKFKSLAPAISSYRDKILNCRVKDNFIYVYKYTLGRDGSTIEKII